MMVVVATNKKVIIMIIMMIINSIYNIRGASTNVDAGILNHGL